MIAGRLVTALDIAAAPSPTAALLWAASRPHPDPLDVANALEAGADLARATEIAIAQRLSPLLWRALGSTRPSDAASRDHADRRGRRRLRADAARCRARRR